MFNDSNMDTKNADFGRKWEYYLRGEGGDVLASGEFSSDIDALNYFTKVINETKPRDDRYQIERSNGFIIVEIGRARLA